MNIIPCPCLTLSSADPISSALWSGDGELTRVSMPSSPSTEDFLCGCEHLNIWKRCLFTPWLMKASQSLQNYLWFINCSFKLHLAISEYVHSHFIMPVLTSFNCTSWSVHVLLRGRLRAVAYMKKSIWLQKILFERGVMQSWPYIGDWEGRVNHSGPFTLDERPDLSGDWLACSAKMECTLIIGTTIKGCVSALEMCQSWLMKP